MTRDVLVLLRGCSPSPPPSLPPSAGDSSIDTRTTTSQFRPSINCCCSVANQAPGLDASFLGRVVADGVEDIGQGCSLVLVVATADGAGAGVACNRPANGKSLWQGPKRCLEYQL